MNSGETFDREINISFPYNSFAGPKVIDCEFLLQNETTTFTVPLQLRLGLTYVGVESIALHNGNDLIIQQMIANYGEQPINYSAFARLPGLAPVERMVINLGPGQTIMKRYVFNNLKMPPSAKARVGLKELDGVRIFNEEVSLQ